MPPEFHIHPAGLDLNQVVADVEAIRRVNPQRFEMEQLTAIVFIDPVQHVIVGYKDVRPDEFWVRGHMPDYPLMPGVLMCEAAAQLCSFYMISQKLVHTEFLGFGGLEKTRFRHPVHPGDRLVLVGKAEKLNRRQMTFDVQGIVGSKMVFQAEVIGMPMSKKEAVS